MKHYSTEEWIDFANHAGMEGLRTEMQTHLDSGCNICKKMAALWGKVQKSAADEARFQPPAEQVHLAKAVFGTAGFVAKRKISQLVAEILFDSFHQPQQVGARAAGSSARQLVFRANPFQIDLQIETMAAGSRAIVTGQLLDASREDLVGGEIPVSLSNRQGQTIQTVTNRFGEFHCELESVEDLQIAFSGRDQKTVVVLLAEAVQDQPVRRHENPRGGRA